LKLLVRAIALVLATATFLAIGYGWAQGIATP
jgi:hypothetical protein